MLNDNLRGLGPLALSCGRFGSIGVFVDENDAEPDDAIVCFCSCERVAMIFFFAPAAWSVRGFWML